MLISFQFRILSKFEARIMSAVTVKVTTTAHVDFSLRPSPDGPNSSSPDAIPQDLLPARKICNGRDNGINRKFNKHCIIALRFRNSSMGQRSGNLQGNLVFARIKNGSRRRLLLHLMQHHP
jgi:hypothetical protein